MDSNTTTGSTASLDAVAIATLERNALWRHYEEWMHNASDDELMQLQAALDTYGTTEVRSLVSVIRQVLLDETEKRKFPASFLAPLLAANWPAAAAYG